METVVDAIIMLNDNSGFHAYMDYGKAQMIGMTGGLSFQENIVLRETQDRPIPESIKTGEKCIVDVLIRLELNQPIYLN